MSMCECILHLPFGEIIKFFSFLFLFLHSLVCLVTVILLRIWFFLSFFTNINSSWMKILNKLPFSFFVITLGYIPKTGITKSKCKKSFIALISYYQIGFENIEPTYNGSSIRIPVSSGLCQLCSIHILKPRLVFLIRPGRLQTTSSYIQQYEL